MRRPANAWGKAAAIPGAPSIVSHFLAVAWRSLQIADIGRDGSDLRLGKLMRNRLHDGRSVRISLVLTPFLVPARQLPEDVVMKLTCQTGKRVGSLGVRPVTGSAWRNLGAGNAFFVDFFPSGHELLRSPSQRFGIEILEIRGQPRQHRWAQNMRHVKHHGVRSPAFDKRLQLILQIFGLLSRQSRHRKGSAKPLRRYPVTGLAIVRLGLELLLRDGGRSLVLRVRRSGDDNGEGDRKSGAE